MAFARTTRMLPENEHQARKPFDKQVYVLPKPKTTTAIFIPIVLTICENKLIISPMQGRPIMEEY